jgi:hypothetical protein
MSSASISARGITGFDHFGVRVFDRGRDHDDRRLAAEIRLAVAEENLGAERPEPLGRFALAQLRARDLVAQVEQDLGDAAHTDAADPDEMNAMFFLEHVNN